ncbi:SDR family oxidoreductase [Achromobacter deleyi]|uniref:SDR family oxidoreductase n=1 Tax=Achromobacter deleyi TaxID=1353891 RepID=UPI001F34CEBB|nr:SDR family oxidoreductase [Achromobacter deleyi]UIP21973.1 SDR family oxidoreductase [Achromobacter deleyi]
MISSGKLALVTGGTRGIGLASGIELLRQGNTVVLTGRSGSVDGEIPAQFKSRVHVMQLDMEQTDTFEPFVRKLAADLGAIDILVNNAGVSLKNAQGHSHGVLSSTAEEFDETMRINALAPMLLTQQVLPGMREKRWGRIVNVASLAGRSKSAVSGPAYMMSKAALLAWTRAVALEMAPCGITCNSIAPGRVLTKMAMQGGDEVNARIAQAIPAGRIGQPEEVAYAVAMLCTDAAAFTTGACLDINGGVFMN